MRAEPGGALGTRLTQPLPGHDNHLSALADLHQTRAGNFLVVLKDAAVAISTARSSRIAESFALDASATCALSAITRSVSAFDDRPPGTDVRQPLIPYMADARTGT